MRRALYAESNAINVTKMSPPRIEYTSVGRVISFKGSEVTDGRSKIGLLPMVVMS
jgi:hypothetical protein